jgi:hypothetical protein
MALLESVYNHLVLPPKLPGQLDTDKDGIESSILTRLVNACDTLAKLSGQEFTQIWASLLNSLRICLNVNQGRLEKKSMLHEFCSLQPNDLLALHVVEQNAALLIRRHTRYELSRRSPFTLPTEADERSAGGDTVIFEAFEVSPPSEDVLAAENAVQWDFPGRAAEIPLDEFLSGSFQGNLADFLEQASMESLKRFKARSTKAKPPSSRRGTPPTQLSSPSSSYPCSRRSDPLSMYPE